MVRQTGLYESILFITIIAICLMIPACLNAGEQAERAISAVEELIHSGKLTKNAAIRLVAKQGNIDNIWGTDYQLKNEWGKANRNLD